LTARVRPGETEVREWMTALSNWGRWGADDQLGTLNLVDAGRAAAAGALIRTGETVSCSIPISYDREPHSVTGRAGDRAAWKTAPMQFVLTAGDLSRPGDTSIVHGSDAFLMSPHGSLITHLDAPCHVLFQGQMYNAIPSHALSAGKGAERGSVDLARHGIVGRGVLLDAARVQGRDWLEDGEAIYPDDLEACERDAGLRAGRGDIVLVRTGYRKRHPRGAAADRPGLQAACLPWIHEREIGLLGSDVAQDVHPHGYSVGSPIHTVGIWSMGLWLLDNCGLEDLAAACARHGRWEFFLSVAPLALTRSTGSPVNPLAVF
jgi:kynurenine formamidase